MGYECVPITRECESMWLIEPRDFNEALAVATIEMSVERTLGNGCCLCGGVPNAIYRLNPTGADVRADSVAVHFALCERHPMSDPAVEKEAWKAAMTFHPRRSLWRRLAAAVASMFRPNPLERLDARERGQAEGR